MLKLINCKRAQSATCMLNALTRPTKMATALMSANIAKRCIALSAKVHEQFEFTKENQLRIDAILSFYPKDERRGALVPMLELAQRQHGWLPMAAMHKVAALLELDPFTVFETAGFYYWLRAKPTGKYRVHVCTGPPCLLRDADKMLETCEKVLGIKKGENTKDMNFSLSGGVCFGACVNGPVVSINDDFYEDLTEKDMTEILESLKKDVVPPSGPRSGRFACEPRKGLTTLKSEPTPAGFKMQNLDVECDKGDKDAKGDKCGKDAKVDKGDKDEKCDKDAKDDKDDKC